MMMDTAIQQQNDPNGQIIVTPNERQALIQRLNSKWPLELSTQIENRAYDKSHGIKANYFKLIQGYYQQIQTSLNNRAQQQQQQQINNNVAFSNPQPIPVPLVSHQLNQSPRFPPMQQIPRMNNPQANLYNQMQARLHEPQKFNQTPLNTLSYSQTPPSTTTTTTTIDLSQNYSSQQVNGITQNDYSSLQPRYPTQPSMNIPRQRQSSFNNTTDINHQYNPTNSSAIANSTGDQLLQRILLSNIDGGANKMPVQPTMMSQPIRPPNPIRSAPSPSVVVIQPPTQTSTVQIQPSNNITIQQSPLSNNSSGPYSVNSQTVSMNSSTPMLGNYSSPSNRTVPLTGSGSISSPDDEILNLIKYLKENVNKLQLLCQKFINEGANEKLRQVQSIHQQIIQFINNPTYETLPNAKNFRDMLDRIPNRAQPPTTIATTTATTDPQTNVFNQCMKSINEFLHRDQKDRMNLTKRYLEPLSDVINGVPHKMMRLDNDAYPAVKNRSYNNLSLFSIINDEIKQLPDNVYSIEYVPTTRSRKISDFNPEYADKNEILLRCNLLEKSNPILPTLRLRITSSYPEQPPEILSLTKTTPPRLEFADGHPFFDQISSVFVSHLFKLRPQHTITDILNIWRESVQTAL